MQREIGDEIHLGATVNPFDSVGGSSTIDRGASNYSDAKEKVKKIRELIHTGSYDADILPNTSLGYLMLCIRGSLKI